jgi:hypothetical protein
MARQGPTPWTRQAYLVLQRGGSRILHRQGAYSVACYQTDGLGAMTESPPRVPAAWLLPVLSEDLVMTVLSLKGSLLDASAYQM